jgi:hypothetical protein
VRIAGRLSETTLGDVLGALFRAQMTGLVRLRETAGLGAGRVHGIYLRQGRVVAVDTPAVHASLGLDEPGRLRLVERLDAVFGLREAVLTFHVACAPPDDPMLPLSPRDYLHGRPRARDRAAHPSSRATVASRARAQALSTLGLDGDATAAEVTRAFRRRARELHPDLHRGTERRSVEQRFAALTAAYHALIG